MLICNVENIPNKKYEILGMTSGVGYAYGCYAQTIHESETMAINEMKHNAEKLGADGLIGVKFTMSTQNGCVTILASGTMIKFKD